MKISTDLRWVCFWSLLLAFVAPCARAQTNIGATMTTSLTATQGETLTYTVVITNRTSNAITGVTLSDVLDPNTTLVAGSINTSPLAFPDSYSVLGNVQITNTAPGVLANDVDLDGVGPALTVLPGSFTSANGGNVVMSANGAFSYNPPRGFEGTDTFTYTLSDGEGFTDIGKVSMSVTGMIWFVNAAAPAGGDGRLSSPFNTLAAFNAINNNAGNNPATNDSIFIYSGNYTGPLTLLNNQKLIGQGATATLSALTGLIPPAGSLALPTTSGVRPIIAGNNGVTLASGNFLRGLNFNNSGGTALGGGNVGALTVLEAAVTNTAGIAINLNGGTLNVVLNSVSAAGGTAGIMLGNTTGSFVVTGDAALAQNGTGGTIQNTTGNGVQLNNVANVSLSRMNINNCAGNGLFGLNVNGLIIDWCALNNNGDATDESGIRLGDPNGQLGLIGTLPAGTNPTRIANTLVRASAEMNVAIFNASGTLAQLEVTNVVSKDTRTRPLGADGFYFETRNAAGATVNFTSCSFSNNFTQGIQAAAFGQSVLNVNIANCGFTNNNEGVVLGNGNDADLVFDVNGNRFFNNLATGASGSAIVVANATTVTPLAVASGKIRNNTVSGGGIDNHLVAALFAGAAQNTLQATNNNINAVNSQFSGIFVQAGETGSGNLNANVAVIGNTVSLGSLGSHGIVVQSRITSALCAEIANNISTTGGVGLNGINVRQRDTSTFRLPGFAGPFNSTAAVITFLQGKNVGSTVGATVATAYSGGASCVLPLLAFPFEASARLEVAKPIGMTSPIGMNSTGQGATELFETPSTKPNSGLELTESALKPIVAAARQRWAETGLSAEQLAVIDSLHFEVTNLAGWYLGASSGRLIQLDRRATGCGWFIDASPLDNSRFAGPAGRIDLFSAVLHEMGHQLGLPDDYTPAARGSVMYGFLAPGERRLPTKGQALNAAPENATGTHYIFTPINIGTLPAGKSITITFRATIANPVPAGICVVTNQATITADGGVSIVTDDPRTLPQADATLTTLLVPPIVATQPASSITGASAVLNGSVNPCGTNAAYYFQYGLTTAYGSNTTLVTVPAGVSSVPVSTPIAGLGAGVTYHFRIIGTNSLGTNAGLDRIFTTPLDIVQQPVNTGACVGGTATFSVTASSPNVSYQWQRRAPGTGSFQNISGATGASYTTAPITSAAADGTGFRVIVSGAATNITSAEALLSVITISAPAVTYNFNNGLPTDTVIYGNAFLSGGVLELNTNAQSQTGAFLTTDLAPGRLVRGFTATFKMRIQPGSNPPADGFSFNWATDLPNGTYAAGEEGEGSGLRVCFDTYDNGLLEAPAIDVKWGTNVIGHYATDLSFLPGSAGDFADVAIRMNPDGTVDVSYRCRAIFSRLPIPGYTPLMNARFGLGSRTGGLNESHGLDDLAIQLVVDPTNGVPRITSISNTPPSTVMIRGTGTPGENVALQATTNFSLWQWRTNVTPDLAGNFQFNENTSLIRNRFYRLGAAPHLPAGLVTWWRAESNFVDSFGPNSGSVTGQVPSFVTGQRGAAFAFNGSNQVYIGGTSIPVPWTACFWVKRQDTVGGSAALLTSPASGLKLEQFGTSRQVGFTAYGVADYSFSYSVPTNTWTHLAFVATQAGTVLYTNGVAVATNAATVSLPLSLLGSASHGADPLRGFLDEVTLFNRALAPAEITNVVNTTRGP